MSPFLPVDERVLGPNPFSREDPRHVRWRDACRSAAEDEAAVLAQTLRRIDVCPENQLSSELTNGVAAAFDIRARYIAALIVRTYDDITAYEHALPGLVDAVAMLACEMCPSFLDKQGFGEQIRIRLTTHAAHWQHQALRLARETESQTAAVISTDTSTEVRCSNWREITIEFLSDHQVQISVGARTYPQNYAEMGFEDRKTGNPNLAWQMLKTIAESEGSITETQIQWEKTEKRVQEIRRTLRAHFNRRHIIVPADDPVPFIKRKGYVAAFRLRLRPSYKS